jgi:hypothetical protein
MTEYKENASDGVQLMWQAGKAVDYHGTVLKIGDTVRIVKSGWGCTNDYVGEEFVIKEFQRTNNTRIKVPTEIMEKYPDNYLSSYKSVCTIAVELVKVRDRIKLIVKIPK